MASYPDTRIEDVTETLAGLSFPDPYRWLERESPEVRQWQRAQAQLASDHVREWPHFDRLRKLVARFSTEQKIGDQYRILPRQAAGRWFRTRVDPKTSFEQVVCSDEPMGEGRLIYDSSVESAERSPFISWISPSPDGRTLALGVCTDGSENNTIRLLDVDTARTIPGAPPQMLMDNWTGGAQWLADSSGFFFTALSGPPRDFAQQIYLHMRTPAPKTQEIDIPGTESRDFKYRWVTVARDGRHAVAMRGLVNPLPVATAALTHEPLQWKPFVASLEGRLSGHLVGNRFIAVTGVGGPRGRLVAIPLHADNPADPREWEDLVPESEAALQTVTVVGDALYISELVDTYARVRIVDFNGKPLGQVSLPDRGALGAAWWYSMHGTFPRGSSEKFLFTFSSFTTSPGIYSHTPGEDRIEVLAAPVNRLQNIEVEDRWAVSKDGTRILFHVVRRADIDKGRPQPTLLYAYGGFNFPLVAQFPGPMAAFIEAGGIYVHAHIRGGSDFGSAWSEGGRKRNKQNGYDDLYAVAESLIKANTCTSQTLALTGRSNGGHMAGVALTQRPDLWKVVVPRVPMFDMIGACRDHSYGRLAVESELADVDDVSEVRRLATISPYQLIREGVKYPAVFIDVGDTDSRCAAWHGRKFAARLQKAAGGGAPVLLHVWENAGHGLATDGSITVTEHTEWLAFVMRHLGLDTWA